MKILAFVFLTVANVSLAKAATIIRCVDKDKPYITWGIDFDGLEIFTTQRGRVIYREKMTSADPKFEDARGFLGEVRRAETATGELEIRKSGGRITGYYKGDMTFGDRWDFVCTEIKY